MSWELKGEELSADLPITSTSPGLLNSRSYPLAPLPISNLLSKQIDLWRKPCTLGRGFEQNVDAAHTRTTTNCAQLQYSDVRTSATRSQVHPAAIVTNSRLQSHGWVSGIV